MQVLNKDIKSILTLGKFGVPYACHWHSTPFREVVLDNAEFYSSRPVDAAVIQTHKRGVGDGLWFRLHDGRVYDKAAEECEPDADLYDSTDN